MSDTPIHRQMYDGYLDNIYDIKDVLEELKGVEQQSKHASNNACHYADLCCEANKRIEELESAIREHEDHYWMRLDEPAKRLGVSRRLWKIIH